MKESSSSHRELSTVGTANPNGSSLSPGATPTFLLVGLDDGFWQTPAACQI